MVDLDPFFTVPEALHAVRNVMPQKDIRDWTLAYPLRVKHGRKTFVKLPLYPAGSPLTGGIIGPADGDGSLRAGMTAKRRFNVRKGKS